MFVQSYDELDYVKAALKHQFEIKHNINFKLVFESNKVIKLEAPNLLLLFQREKSNYQEYTFFITNTNTGKWVEADNLSEILELYPAIA